MTADDPSLPVGERPAPTPACATCRFAEINVLDDSTDTVVVECRRYPPVVIVPQGAEDDGDAAVTFPHCHEGYWCGEYRAAAGHGEVTVWPARPTMDLLVNERRPVPSSTRFGRWLDRRLGVQHAVVVDLPEPATELPSMGYDGMGAPGPG